MNAILKSFRAVDAGSMLHSSNSPLGPRATKGYLGSNATPSHDHYSAHYGLGSPRVAPVPKRNLNDLPFGLN